MLSPSYRLEESQGTTRILIGNYLLMSINDADAAVEKTSRRALAEKRAQIVENSIRQYRADLHPKNILIRTGFSLLTTLVFLFFWRTLGWISHRLERFVQNRVSRVGTILKFVLLSEQLAQYFLKYFARFLLWFARIILLYSYIFVILSIFPETRGYADHILFYLLQPVQDIAGFILDFLPNLFTIIVILVFFWYILGFIRLFSREVEKGVIVLGGFHHEWAAPTYTIIRLLAVALAFIAIFPYIPGSHSPVFQGISVFLGLLFSVSSSSALSNIVAGYVLIYTRAFKEGDVIRAGEHTGVVIQKALLATQVRTFKNEVVTVPNSLLIGSSIMNYSAQISEKGLTLHTTITIGYDAPWRIVHELMKCAAARTEGILSDPPPFVLQTALNDFYVAYELNAFTCLPSEMPRLYSDLHHNIQDCFNEAGVEIMSPHYTAFRNGNPTTIPANHPSGQPMDSGKT
jgi:small-conductance mechanosensitive channel